jgi:hypothetical protein
MKGIAPYSRLIGALDAASHGCSASLPDPRAGV